MGGGNYTNSLATYVNQAAPTVNNDATTGLPARTGGGGDCQVFMYFPRPFPLAATIVSAELVFYTGTFTTGTHTYTFQRLNQSFSASKVTWNTRPTSLIAGTKVLTKTGVLADKTEWRLTVTDWMQSIASGGVWYGIRLLENEAVARYIYSEVNPATAYRPRLEITWSDAPSTPTGLSPSGGRSVGIPKPIVRATYVDVSGATQLLAAQVQLNATDVWTAPTTDTGIVLTSVPEVDLAGSWGRTATVGTTNTSTNITAAALTFETADIGALITGAGIPALATITAVAVGGASATLSAAATATASITATMTRSYAGLADGATVFWRVRFQDASGLWSPYSASTSFKRDDKGALTVTSPPVGTPIVEDATPPIIWTFTGETQSAYQIQIRHGLGLPFIDWDSGKVTSTAAAVTVPTGTVKETGTTYTVTVRIWDTDQREATPNDPTYVEVVRDFTFVPGATLGTTGLTAVANANIPKVALTWQRSSAPDGFNILRNGKVIVAGLLPADLFVSGTTYTYTDQSPSPKRLLTYSVQAVVNSVASATNATATATATNSDSVWLRDPASGLELCIRGRSDRDFELGEESAALQSIARNANKVAINQSLGGLEGTIEGELSEAYGKTAAQWRDVYLQLRELRVRKMWLTVGDYTFLAVCQKFTLGRRSGTGGIPVYPISFIAYQQDSILSMLSTA